jgi:hypothetical protein
MARQKLLLTSAEFVKAIPGLNYSPSWSEKGK